MGLHPTGASTLKLHRANVLKLFSVSASNRLSDDFNYGWQIIDGRLLQRFCRPVGHQLFIKKVNLSIWS